MADIADLGRHYDGTSYVVPTLGRPMAMQSRCASTRKILTRDFFRRPGGLRTCGAPSGPGIRDDSGAFEGWTVPTAYDPLVSKVIAWAPDRAGAIARMVRALTEYDLRGISTTIGFCRDLVRSPEFAAADFDTTYVDRLVGRERQDRRDRATRWKRLRPWRRRYGRWRRRSSSTRTAGTRSTTSTLDDPSGRSAHGWSRCDERRGHGERPPVEGGARACRTSQGKFTVTIKGKTARASTRRGSTPTRCRSSTTAWSGRFASMPATTTARLAWKSAATLYEASVAKVAKRVTGAIFRLCRRENCARPVPFRSKHPCPDVWCACWSPSAIASPPARGWLSSKP